MEHDLENILAALNRLLPNHDRITEIEYLPGGYSNRNYHVRSGSEDFILRLCSKKPSSTQTEFSYLNLTLAPTLIEYERSTGNMVTREVHGSLLVHQPFTVLESVQYLQYIHSTIPIGIRKHDPVAVSLDHFAKSGVRNELREFVETTSWSPRRLVGSHNDLNPYNIIRTVDGSVVTLDWEFAGDNEGLFDLANLCSGLGYSDEEFDESAALYSGSFHETEYLVLTRMVFQAREHSWALAQIAEGNDRDEIRAQVREARTEFHRIRDKYL